MIRVSDLHLKIGWVSSASFGLKREDGKSNFSENNKPGSRSDVQKKMWNHKGERYHWCFSERILKPSLWAISFRRYKVRSLRNLVILNLHSIERNSSWLSYHVAIRWENCWTYSRYSNDYSCLGWRELKQELIRNLFLWWGAQWNVAIVFISIMCMYGLI